MYDPLQHHYYVKLLKLFEEGKVPPGRLDLVDIYHDEWCALHWGGYCNCDPEIEVRPLSDLN